MGAGLEERILERKAQVGGLCEVQDVGVGPNAAFLPDFHLSRCSVLGVAPGVGELESLGVPY